MFCLYPGLSTGGHSDTDLKYSFFCFICFLTRCIATCRPIGAPGQKGLQIPIIEIMLRLANQKLTSLKRSLRTNKIEF